MAEINVNADLNLGAVSKLIAALMDPQSSDPGAPVDGQVWYNSTANRLKVRVNGTTQSLAHLDDVTAGSITSALWDAQTVITAIIDDTPVATTLAEGTVLGRLSGGDIGAVTLAALVTALEGVGLDADTLEGQAGSYYLSLGNATGTLTTTEISDFTSAVNALIANVVDSAPAALDTLNEIAASLNDDADFAGTMTTALATKVTKYSTLIGDGASTALAVTHNLGTTEVQVEVFVVSTGATVLCEVVRTNANTVTLNVNTAPASNAYRVVVHGIA